MYFFLKKEWLCHERMRLFALTDDTTPPQIFSIKVHVYFRLNLPRAATHTFWQPISPMSATVCTGAFVMQPMVKVEASVLKCISGLGDTDDMNFKDRVLRRMGQGQLDRHGVDVSDYYVLLDVVVVVLFSTMSCARKWLRNCKKLQKSVVPSLTHIKDDKVRLLNACRYNCVR